MRDNEFGYFEPDAGFLRPEACVGHAAGAGRAPRRGDSHRRISCRLAPRRALRARDDRQGESIWQGVLILAAGAWLPEILGADFQPLFRVLRQVLYWFDVRRNFARFVPERCPVFIWELQGRRTGDLWLSGDRRAARRHQDRDRAICRGYDAATRFRRSVSEDETRAMYRDLCRALSCRTCRPVASRRRPASTRVTPDAGFIIDRHPACDAVLIVSACSGHGFKHSAAIGEAVAEWALDGRRPYRSRAIPPRAVRALNKKRGRALALPQDRHPPICPRKMPARSVSCVSWSSYSGGSGRCCRSPPRWR